VDLEEGADVADDGAAGAAGMEDLIEEPPEGAATGEDPFAAVGALVGLGQECGGQVLAEEVFEVVEVVLAHSAEAAATGGEAGAPGREVRGRHDKYIYLSTRDVQGKMRPMKPTSAPPQAWKRQYERLRQRLARLGYISQGSVLNRATLTPPRSGYQWTRKVGQKTITVALSRAQYDALKRAVHNERSLWKTVAQMEKVSRQILFETVPDTRHRKRLSKRVLGLI